MSCGRPGADNEKAASPEFCSLRRPCNCTFKCAGYWRATWELVNYCVTATPLNGTFRLTNICSFVVQVVLDQPGGGTVEGMPVQPQSFTLQLLPKESTNEGWTGKPFTVWVCAGSNSPFSRATHKIPVYGDYNVYCPTDGNAGSAQ